MNINLLLLTLCQGLYLTNNVAFIAMNGLVGWRLAPAAWMATLPVMGYVLGGALATPLVARVQARFGRRAGFQIGLLVAAFAALLCAWAIANQEFWWVCAGTLLAGYFNANAQLYRFAAAELVPAANREKAVSWVLTGGLIGAVAGPNLAKLTQNGFPEFASGLTRTWGIQGEFAATYISLAGVALVGLVVMAFIRFPGAAPVVGAAQPAAAGRSNWQLVQNPVFLVAMSCGALSFGVMNLLMAATPLAMQACGLTFSQAAWVLEWHVIGMFAPGFFTGHLISRFGAQRIMAVGVALNALCVAIALSGVDVHRFFVALLVLGVGWNFVFTGATSLSLTAYAPVEKDRAQALLNFTQFAVLAVSSFSSGALVTGAGWQWLNLGSLVPVLLMGLALVWLARRTPAA